VAEFDYRQNLHMECGVVALEPPPPYTIAMKELTHQVDGEREPDEGTYRRGSPPPYMGSDGEGR
jgi:hypothetical protein